MILMMTMTPKRRRDMLYGIKTVDDNVQTQNAKFSLHFSVFQMYWDGSAGNQRSQRISIRKGLKYINFIISSPRARKNYIAPSK